MNQWASWTTHVLSATTLPPNGRAPAAFKIFRAAFTSRCIDKPQSGHECHRSESSLLTPPPHPEHTCEVEWGATRTTVLPAHAALQESMLANGDQPTSEILWARL
jgi:hypothetical protein